MNVVLDTNVLVSGLLFGGVPGRILSAWTDEVFQLVITPARRVSPCWSRTQQGTRTTVSAVESLLAMLTVHAMLVNAPSLDERVSDDPDDDMFLAAALAANARVIVSGDKHLLSVSGWQQIEVLRPR